MGCLSSSGYSFDDLCAPLWPEMCNYASKLTFNNRTLAEDVVQDSMIKAMAAWERWSPEEMEPAMAARAWMYRVVSSVALNAFRRSRLEKRSMVDRSAELLEALFGESQVKINPERGWEASEGGGGSQAKDYQVAIYREDQRPDYSADQPAVCEEVADAVARLHPDRRTVIERYYFQGESCEQIAEDLSVPAATIRTRLDRARKKLAPLLQRFARDNGLLARVHAPAETLQVKEPDPCGVETVVRHDYRGPLRRVKVSPDQAAAG